MRTSSNRLTETGCASSGAEVPKDPRHLLSRRSSDQICTDDKADTVRRHPDQFARSHQQGGRLNRTLAPIFH